MSDSVLRQLRPPAPWMLWSNPLFRRFCRSRLRARGLGISLVLVLIIASFITIFIPLAVRSGWDRQHEMQQQWAQELTEWKARNPGGAPPEGLEMLATRRLSPRPPETTLYRLPLLALLGLQAAILFLGGTGQVAGGMTTEADEGSTDYMRLTPITPLTKSLGYLFGLPVREYVLFAFTLPFTAWCLWKGAVEAHVWLPVYGIFLLTCLLYHLTGLVSGTVLRSKRWAFLLSMGLILLLYVIVPWGARFGFPFLRYLTLWPVLLHQIAPLHPEAVTALSLAGGAGDGVPFFTTVFTEIAFTLLVQGSFVLALLVMIWRKWKRSESHLLSKGWGLAVFVWVNVLLIGNALPLAQSGDLFPSANLAGRKGTVSKIIAASGGNFRPLAPQWGEAVGISAAYALLLLITLLLLAIMITPSGDTQQRGLRRALRGGQNRAPPGADEASGFPLIVILTLLAVAAWTFFHRGMAAAEWFRNSPQGNPWFATLCMALVISLTVLAFQTMLESGGGRGPFLSSVFIGVVPLLAAAIVSVSGFGREATYWTAGISPITQITYASSRLAFLPNASLGTTADLCFLVWVGVMSLFVLRNLGALRRTWLRRRNLTRDRMGDDASPAAAEPAVREKLV